MEIEIQIDELTDCLVERETGKLVDTYYEKRNAPIKPKDFKGWKFDWSKPEKNGYDIYELFLKDSKTVQGRIAYRVDGGVVDVDVVESAPQNIGHNGKYEGVGGHLFALACQASFEAGCDGFVAFTSKTNLMEHYKESLGAEVIGGQRMCIDEKAARILTEKYLKR